MWDVINEAVIAVLDRYDTPVQRIGRIELIRAVRNAVGQSARDIVIERL